MTRTHHDVFTRAEVVNRNDASVQRILSHEHFAVLLYKTQDFTHLPIKKKAYSAHAKAKVPKIPSPVTKLHCIPGLLVELHTPDEEQKWR